jgi:hypothetical protein
MDNETAEIALQAADQLEAQESLLSISIGSFADLKKEDRTKMHREIHKRAFPKVHESKRAISGQELAVILNGRR